MNLFSSTKKNTCVSYCGYPLSVPTRNPEKGLQWCQWLGSTRNWNDEASTTDTDMAKIPIQAATSLIYRHSRTFLHVHAALSGTPSAIINMHMVRPKIWKKLPELKSMKFILINRLRITFEFDFGQIVPLNDLIMNYSFFICIFSDLLRYRYLLRRFRFHSSCFLL